MAQYFSYPEWYMYGVSYVIQGLLIGKNEIYDKLKYDMHALNSNA